MVAGPGVSGPWVSPEPQTHSHSGTLSVSSLSPSVSARSSPWSGRRTRSEIPSLSLVLKGRAEGEIQKKFPQGHPEAPPGQLDPSSLG